MIWQEINVKCGTEDWKNQLHKHGMGLGGGVAGRAGWEDIQSKTN